jgi:Cu(I)/Ag(I) efflux system periplasmic protein CusF
VKSLFIPWAVGAVLAMPAAIAAHIPSHLPEARATNGAYTEAEVRKVDKEAGKITLRHGPIANLDMPAMSMVFRAKDASMLDHVKEGDKVRFKAEKLQGAYTVTELLAVK